MIDNIIQEVVSRFTTQLELDEVREIAHHSGIVAGAHVSRLYKAVPQNVLIWWEMTSSDG